MAAAAEEPHPGFRAPPVLDMGSSPMAASTSEPFLCATEYDHPLERGFPRSLPELEALSYLFGECPLPQMCVGSRYEDPESQEEARATLARCTALRLPFWLSVESEAIRHPAWWPADASTEVGAYQTIIAGHGASGIGMHRDAFNCHLVSTYITVGIGRKRVVLLPPTAAGNALAVQRLRARDPLAHPDPTTAGSSVMRVRAAIPPRPSAELVDAILAAGGYWFVLGPSEDGRATTLFMPGGWWHWLAGDEESAFHVATSGSFRTPDAAIPAAARRVVSG